MTEPNAAPPAPNLGVPYTGRIVLRAPLLRDQGDEYNKAWAARLQILGATANITFDDDRGVIDVYGLATDELDRVARVLTDPGWGYMLGGLPMPEGVVFEWTKPDAYCNCSGRIRVALSPPGVMCDVHDGPHIVRRDTWSANIDTVVYWMQPGSSRYFDHPPGQQCATAEYAPSHLLVDLPAGASRDEDIAILLAFGGHQLPEAPQIVQVARGQAVAP